MCANDFIPANDYNPDEFDIINEDEHFNFPEQQECEKDMYAEENDIDNENHQNVPVADNLRFGLRERKKPSWHNDYIMHCNTIDATTSNTKQFTSPHFPPTYPYYHSDLLTQTHKSLLSTISQIQEPTSYNEACRNEEWIKAMNKELDALENNQTWTVMPLPQNKKAIGSKWVYKVKLNPDGSVERYKARLVAKRYNQIYGIDYLDSFSPVAKVITIRILLALSTSRGWLLNQLDINNAFLHGFLDEEVYLQPPQGYGKAKKGEVCKLNKSLYGLKQASRQWHLEFCNKLLEIDFKQSSHDHCLFIKGERDNFIALVVYVDDVFIPVPNEILIQEVKKQLHETFTIKDLGVASYFLGIELLKTEKGLHVNQRKHVMDILVDDGLTRV